MNKLKIATISICFTAIHFFSHAQSGISDVYTENINVHTNTDLLITGETLYYSVYCLSDEKNGFSTLSKLAYVELIGENEKPFFQTKVPLVNGTGAGDFFIPSTLPSGNYVLIAYTKWMRNFSIEHFFQKQITIVNPYHRPFITNDQVVNDKEMVSIHSVDRKPINRTNQIHLTSDKNEYTRRQKVIVTIKNNDPLFDCKISLGIHQTSTSEKSDSINKRVNSEYPELQEKKNVTFLPDLRGETISGIVKDKVLHQPVVSTNIYLSVSGSSKVFQVSTTDLKGRFYFSTKNIQTQNGIQLQIEGESDAIEVFLDDEFINDYGKFKPSPFSIDTTFRRLIEQRNVYSQIENAYYEKKRDSVLEVKKPLFFGVPDKVYKLDDFTRFPTMEDIFREYMLEVVVSKRDKKFVLRLINARNGSRFLNTPLMLVDGVMIFDTEVLMNYNPLLIKSISLVTRKYIYGGILFEGILSVETYEGNAKELPVTRITKNYTPWQYSKEYYSPIYNTADSLKRIPDYRVQLFWNPEIEIASGKEITVEFYTSDVPGDFTIEVNGFSLNGEMVNAQQNIKVQK